MSKPTISLLAALILYQPQIYAEEIQGKLIETITPMVVNGINITKTSIDGVINLDQISDEPLSNCAQKVHKIKVDGLQYTPSGTTLESIRYIDQDVQWVVPTNFDSLNNVDRSRASNWVRVGRKYLVHIQICGSGGFASLINIYGL